MGTAGSGVNKLLDIEKDPLLQMRLELANFLHVSYIDRYSVPLFS